jgi:hypothetical protein
VIHAVSMKDSDIQLMAVEMSRAAMKDRLSSKPEIADFLIPTFGVGCRRPTPGPGYLEALVQPNVDFITDSIVQVTPVGVDIESGRQVELDCLVCATGFHTSTPPVFPVYGQGGLSLRERFKPYPEAYLSLAVDGFPNFFMMLGPNSGIGSGSLTMMLEAEGDYVVQCIRKLQKEDYSSMCVKKERVTDWSDFCQSYFRKTVYTDHCHSWYKSEGGSGDRIVGLWPGSTLHALEALRAPRWEDFDWENVGGSNINRMGWLGNGWSMTQMKTTDEGAFLGDPAWYLEPRFQNVPMERAPEEDPEFKLRPYSH